MDRESNKNNKNKESGINIKLHTYHLFFELQLKTLKHGIKQKKKVLTKVEKEKENSSVPISLSLLSSYQTKWNDKYIFIFLYFTFFPTRWVRKNIRVFSKL